MAHDEWWGTVGHLAQVPLGLGAADAARFGAQDHAPGTTGGSGISSIAISSGPVHTTAFTAWPLFLKVSYKYRSRRRAIGTPELQG